MMVVHWASKLVDLVSNAVLLSLSLLRLELLTQVPRNVCFFCCFFFVIFAGSEPSGCALSKDFDVTYF